MFIHLPLAREYTVTVRLYECKKHFMQHYLIMALFCPLEVDLNELACGQAEEKLGRMNEQIGGGGG